MTNPANTPQAMFFSGSDNVVDLLNNAVFVTRFLCEVSESFAEGRGPGLSEDGTQGLYQILNAVEGTINEAIIRM